MTPSCDDCDQLTARAHYDCLSFVTDLSADIDECARNTDNCDQLCVNLNGTYKCACRPGYTLNANERKCDGEYIKEVVVYTDCGSFTSLILLTCSIC